MATDIYLFFKSPDIAGDSEDKENKGAIEILSFSDGSSMPTTDGRSFAGSGTSGIADFRTFQFSKLVDSASVPLMKHCWQGTHFAEVLVKCYRTTGDGQRICYLEIKMEGCVITDAAWSASNGGLPGETYSLDYGKITYTYADTEKLKGSQKAQKVVSYDRVTNKVS
ncbi:MAG: hypothetical protein KatS3mg039_0129 [Candidatus Kapaibacterium sp.]|nr:MAG: hypothetical protein KatS3mg039_0129 [Candidatus Kapabacteria bacterium]